MSTEIINNTQTLEYTNIYTETATETDIVTATIQETTTDLATVTQLNTIVEPTTLVSVWVSTQVMNDVSFKFLIFFLISYFSYWNFIDYDNWADSNGHHYIAG